MGKQQKLILVGKGANICVLDKKVEYPCYLHVFFSVAEFIKLLLADSSWILRTSLLVQRSKKKPVDNIQEIENECGYSDILCGYNVQK